MTRLALTLCALVAASAAHAEITSLETERSMVIGLRLGSLTPGVDDQFDFSPGPYETIFGNGGDTAFSLLYEQHVFTGFGALSLGGGIGYWSAEGKGISSSATATDVTEFVIYPLQLQAAYRFDRFADTVPFVPVLRAGVNYYAWEILDGDGDTAKFEPGKEAKGGTWGYHYAVGLHLLLDFFSQEMAADFDRDAGVNNSYLTFDYEVTTVDDFGSADSFRLGSKTLYIGLAIEL